ncbi:hypothetical protein ACJW30_06G086400 [Castanea mollissima]
MNPKALIFLALLFASVLLISSAVATETSKYEEKQESEPVEDSKYGGYGGGYGGGHGGYGGGHGGHGGGHGGGGHGRGGGHGGRGGGHPDGN